MKDTFKIHVPLNQLEETPRAILEKLMTTAKSDKELANEFNVELAIVKRLKKRFCVEIKEARTLSSEETKTNNDVNKDVKDTNKKNHHLNDEQKFIIEMLNDKVPQKDIAYALEKEPWYISKVKKYLFENGFISEDLYKSRNDTNKNKTAVSRTTQEERDKIVKMYLDGVPKVNIAKNFNRGISTIDRVIKRYKEEKINNINTNDGNTSTTDNDSDDTTVLIPVEDKTHPPLNSNQIPYISAILCKGRHQDFLKINKFIFNGTIRRNLMFDYEKLENMCVKWLKDNILIDDNSGIPCEGLSVYTTGLNCLNAAIIRACYIMKINLDMYQYHHTQNEYHKQVIFDDFPTGKYDSTLAIYKMAKSMGIDRSHVKFNDENISEVINNDFYIIEIIQPSIVCKKLNIELKHIHEIKIYSFTKKAELWDDFEEYVTNAQNIKKIMSMKENQYMCKVFKIINNKGNLEKIEIGKM